MDSRSKGELRLDGREMVEIKVPEGLEGEIYMREYRHGGRVGTVLISRDKTYRLVCREDSNTKMVRRGGGVLSEIKMCLECSELKYGSKEIAELVPEVRLEEVKEEKFYVPMGRVMEMYPMSNEEYQKIMQEIDGIIITRGDRVYLGKLAKKLVLDVLMLVRSLIISKREKCSGVIKEEFKEIFPEELYQLVERYSVDGVLDPELIQKEIVKVLRLTVDSDEEFQKQMKINRLG
ncbi:hypothetical protein NEHOM01_2075 [Nematocida homosporus]|uniref:uncharacterized protein n=1 Tax=Nematocida homosporus TaxID=1912981 RepID=UPI00221F0008|nr:uncharacterized protein NEHOM01_2075 [Nematocida homosporus]KAI5187297.1 hypothetical protein NEHOM01_2075 [Nematocida homosporus]